MSYSTAFLENNFPPGMSDRDWAHVNGGDDEPDSQEGTDFAEDSDE